MTVLTSRSDPMKRCSKCEVVKPLTEFYKHSRMPDGFAYDCKACRKQYHAALRNNAEELIASAERVARLEAVLRGLLDSLPRMACENFSHRKADYHNDDEQCPAMIRYYKAEDDARQALGGAK